MIGLSATGLRVGSVLFADKTDGKSLHLNKIGSSIILVLRNSVNLFAAPTSGLTDPGTMFMMVERVAAIALVSLGVFALRSRVQR